MGIGSLILGVSGCVCLVVWCLQEASQRLQPEIAAGRLEVVHDNFRNLGSILAQSKTMKER